MKTLAIALIIFSLLAAPKVIADEHSGSSGPTKSQEELHESAQAKIHENEPFDATSSPTPEVTVTPTATPTESPVESPTSSPTISPSPTSTPEVQGLEQGQSNGQAGGFLGQISNLLKQILTYLESLGPKA